MLAVIEIQKDGETASQITQLFTDAAEAKARYHEVLAAAAVSDVPEHSAILVSEDGSFMFHEKYYHGGDE